jgi:hypothetical protein
MKTPYANFSPTTSYRGGAGRMEYRIVNMTAAV